jgi:putative ABC transport system permease protein
VSYADYEDYRQQSHSFTELAARTQSEMTLTLGGQSEHVGAAHATRNLFDLFRIQPQLGRTFAAGEDEPGRDGEAVLTHAFWQTHFGGRGDVLGQPVVLDGRTYVVVGVMPQSFDHVEFTSLWLPLALTPEQKSDRTVRNVVLTGRLARGASVATARAELGLIAREISRRYPRTNEGRTVRIRPLVESINGDLTPTFTEIIMAGTLLLMLIVCANISNLQFARTIRRGPEMAMRCALGSSRARIMRQLLVESLTQSLLGVAAGLLLAKVLLHYIVISMPQQVSRFLAGWSVISLSGRTLAYSVGIAVAAGLIAGVAPALAGMRVNLLEQLKSGSRSVSASAQSHRLRNIFAGVQIMLATALIAGAALITASVYTMLHATERFSPRETLTFNAYLPTAQYTSAARQAEFVRDSLSALNNLRGVRSAEFTTALPYNNTGVWWQDFSIAGDPALPGETRTTQRLTVSPGFLHSLGVPLLQGRFLSASDAMDGPRVAVISKRMAGRYFGEKNPIGEHIQLGKDAAATEVTIVGVVGDVLYTWVDQTPQAAVYLSSAQFPTSSGTYVLRTDGDPQALAQPVREIFTNLDRTVALNDIETYAEFLHASLIGLSYAASMLGGDAGIALFLCALGIFGVMANLVSERTHEIGIRFAMGADRAAITGLMLRRSLKITLWGLAAGTLLAFEVSQVLAGILEGIRALQSVLLIGVTMTVGAISLLAGYVPARRAAEVDPTVALHAE